ncbi:MAG: PAS domain-containing protein [Pseudomonadota bacterium]|nr:PAS domain-containing protein [Pseudomonadota bacterium]
MMSFEPQAGPTGEVTTAASLSRQNAELAAITHAATRMLGAAGWLPALPDLLERLGTAIGASRAYLLEAHAAPTGAGGVHTCRCMWSAPGIEPIVDRRFRNLAKLLRDRNQSEVLHLTRQQATGEACTQFDEHHTLAMLSVPIVVDGVSWGSLGFDDCLKERNWDPADVDLLKTATELIAAAIGRARADERLRERDGLHVAAQRIAHVGNWVLDFASDTVSWSEESRRIFGLEPGRETWTHEENLQHIHADDRARVAQMDAAARKSGEPFDIEYRVLRPDGGVRTLRERAEPVIDAVGRPIRLLGVVHDITEMKITETLLRESEQRYALAARGAGVGLWDWNVETDQAYFSPRLHEIVGVADPDLGRSISGLFDRLVAEDRVALQHHLHSRFAGQRRRFEFEGRLAGGPDGVRWLLIRGLILYENGRPTRLVGSLGDTTDRKRAMEELARQREAFYQNEKMAMLGSLLAGVAHELNNPLSVVIGQVALLQQTVDDPAVLKRADRIYKATERCARIVRTFLAMARQRHREPAPVKINGIVETAVELLSFQLRSADFQVVLELAADLPAVSADADQIHQVLTNLIVNARQALAATAAPRTIRIATRLSAADGQLRISVSDNGPGIPKPIRKRIFDPFFTTKPVGEGTGIGLSLCSSIVRAHRGDIVLSETPGGGATFGIMLPLQTGGSAVAHEVQQVDSVPAGLQVLVVEDETEIAETLGEILRSQGHTADLVGDGLAGLESALRGDYDCILSDIRLPGLDGLGLYRALRRKRPSLIDRLAFITGDTLSTEIQSFLAETRSPFLEKPFVPADIVRLMAQIMEGRPRQS